MELPPLLDLRSEEEYREHYVRTLVRGPAVVTRDGALVRFFEERFEHAFFKKSDRWRDSKDIFAVSRAQRMDWIRALLMSETAEMFREPCGLGQSNRLALDRSNRYLVVTVTVRPREERFVTAYDEVSEDKVRKIAPLPRWG